MEKIIQLYRKIIDSEAVPQLLKRFVAKVGRKSVAILYKNRQVRAWDYKIKAFGNPFYLTADWMDYNDGYILSQPVYEEDISRFIYETLKSAQSFVDLGSNIGYFPLLIAS